MRAAFALLALSLLPSAAQGAYLLLEPYVGYEGGKFKSTLAASGAVVQFVNAELGGAAFGGRAGVGVGHFLVGGDYQSATMKFRNSGGGIRPRDTGVFVLYSIPFIRLRIWGNYIFKTKSGALEGSGMKVGIGYRFFPAPSLNVEIIKRKFEAHLGSSLAPSKLEASSDTYLVSLSLPLQF